MKIRSQVTSDRWQVAGDKTNRLARHAPSCHLSLVTRHSSGFTMVEIAISLAVIGIALVAIIGVLPLGMHTQRDNREQTVINQDSTVLLEAIRGGARGMDDLTNYVYAVVNSWSNSITHVVGVNNYTTTNYSIAAGFYTSSGSPLNSGQKIIGLLSTPEYTDTNGLPVPNLFSGGYSNHVAAYVRSLSGPAVEKPPQDNDIVVNDSFSYRLLCVNAPAADPQLAASLRELRLTFFWPLQPNGALAANPQHLTFRATIGGKLVQDPTNNFLYFYQSQSFANAP